MPGCLYLSLVIFYTLNYRSSGKVYTLQDVWLKKRLILVHSVKAVVQHEDPLTDLTQHPNKHVDSVKCQSHHLELVSILGMIQHKYTALLMDSFTCDRFTFTDACHVTENTHRRLYTHLVLSGPHHTVDPWGNYVIVGVNSQRFSPIYYFSEWICFGCGN